MNLFAAVFVSTDDGGRDREDDRAPSAAAKRQVHERDREAARQPDPLERRGRAGRAAARPARRRRTGRRREQPRSRAPTRARAAAAGPTSWTQRGTSIRGVPTGRSMLPARRRTSPAARTGTGPFEGRSRSTPAASTALKPEEPFATVPRDAAPGATPAARAAQPPAPGARAAPAPSRRRSIVVVAIARDAAPVRLRRRRARPSQAPRPASAARLLPAGPAAARDRRPPRHAAPAAADQPVARDGDRLPGRRREARSRSSPLGTQANEGAAEARRARDLRRLDRHAALVPAPRRRRARRLVGARRRRARRHRRLLAGRRHGRRDRRRRRSTAARTARASTSSRPARRRSSSRSRTFAIDPALVVGSPLSAAATKLGSRRRLLARGASGALALHERLGEPRRVEVHPSATLALD